MSWGYDGTILWVLWAMLGGIVLVGGLVAYRALVAARTRPSTPMVLLASGLLMISIGMPALWMVAYVATDNILWCSLVAVAGILVGFVLVLLSLETRRA